MALTLDKPKFGATHTMHGVPVMKNPEWLNTHGMNNYWIDESGGYHRSGNGYKAEPIPPDELPFATKLLEGGEFGVTYARVGEVIPSEWYRNNAYGEMGPKGVMVTREAAACVLRASSWPDSDAPCGQAGNSKDDDASIVGKDREGNSVVRLFMRGKGYVKVKVPRTMFFEIVEE